MTQTDIMFYFSFAAVGMFYTFFKFGINRTSLLMILVFWEGLFDYFDDFVGLSGILSILNIYKIALVIYALSISWKNFFSGFNNKSDLIVNTAFALFSASFWITYYFYGGALSTILSQYLYKYAFVWIAYHYFKDINYNIPKREYVKSLLMTILSVQISISTFKIFLEGFEFEYEGLVGSMSYGGGGPAVVIPIVALIFYWLIRNGSFNKKDWIYAFMILIIAIASGKRQPVIIYPAVLLALFVFVSKSVRLSALFKYVPIAFLFFYIGVRSNTTFTPEGVVGGRFDILFVRDYVMKYYFGTTKINEIFSEDFQGVGRGAGFALYFKPKLLSLMGDKEILFGKGRYEVAVQTKGMITDTRSGSYGIQHTGLLGETASLLYSFGYVGSILLFFMGLSIIFSVKNKRFAWVIFSYFLWDFLFYYNEVLFFNSSGLIVLIIIHYANSVEIEKRAYLKPHLQIANR